MSETLHFWDGSTACAEGAILAGLGLFAGYPITPSTAIAERLAWRLPQESRVFIQMEDEIASLAVALGASMGGLKTMTATSGPGFSLMQENIGYACMAELPVVIVDVQRAGPSTGQPTSPSQGDYLQAVWGTHGDHPAIVLSPSSAQDMLDMTVRAFNLAERFRVPVILLSDQVVATMRERVTVPDHASLELWERPRPDVPPSDYRPYADTEDGVPPMAPFGEGDYRYQVTGLFHDEHGFPTISPEEIAAWTRRVFRKIDHHLDLICRWDLTVPADRIPDCEALLVCHGVCARSAWEAESRLRERGVTVATLRLQTVWPLHDAALAPLLRAARRVVVLEMNRGQMLREIQRLVGDAAPVEAVLRYDGELVSPRAIESILLPPAATPAAAPAATPAAAPAVTPASAPAAPPSPAPAPAPAVAPGRMS